MKHPPPNIPALAYTWKDMFLEQPGLGHMKEIVRHLLREAASCGRTALLPVLSSNHLHFPGPRRVLNWSDYFDWSDYPAFDPAVRSRRELGALLDGFPSVQILSAKDPALTPGSHSAALLVRHFPDSDIFSHLPRLPSSPALDRFDEPVFSDHFPAGIHEAAQAIAAEFSSLRGVLHLRRGDLAGADTSVEAVCRHLSSRDVQPGEPIFVMTNERDPGYLNALRARFPGIVYEAESRVLQRLLRDTGGDNYLSFRICKCLQSKYDFKKLGTLRFMSRAPAASRRNRLLARLGEFNRRVTPSWLQKHQSSS